MKRRTATKCHDGNCELSSTHRRKGKLIAIVYVGIDLAKNVFAVHGVNALGKPRAGAPRGVTLAQGRMRLQSCLRDARGIEDRTELPLRVTGSAGSAGRIAGSRS